MTRVSYPLAGAVAALGLLAVAAAAIGLSVSAAGPARRVVSTVAPMAPAGATIQAVGAENFYADVIRQIGGSHVAAFAIISNPTIDPHSYESSTAAAAAVARAALVVQNGLGYDSFMGQLEAASPSKNRTVVDVGRAFGRRAGDNPHQWYDPATMPRVAALVAADLTRLDPAHGAAYMANLRRFDGSLRPWTRHVAALRRRYRGTPIAVTEPVFGYLADAIGLDVRTPRSFQLAVQEGTDPAPQDVRIEEALFTANRVKMFAYNQQAVAPITAGLLPLARAHHIPIVGVYESMPLHGDYQQWMEAETDAVDRALARGISTEQIR